MSHIKLDETIFSMRRLLMVILWPSFLSACVFSLALFSLVDLNALFLLDGSHESSNDYIRSITFFILWFIGAMASALTTLLMCKSR